MSEKYQITVTQYTTCRCGCGKDPVRPKSEYLPGHDAKHTSIVSKALAATYNHSEWDSVAEKFSLVSPLLIEQAKRIALRIQAKG